MTLPVKRHTHTQQQALGVRPIDATLWAVSSSSPHKSPHLVRKVSDSAYSCDCEDYFYRKSLTGEHCRHIKAVVGGVGARWACANCGEHLVAVEGDWCDGCEAILAAWNESCAPYKPVHRTIGSQGTTDDPNAPVEQSLIYREALAVVQAGEDAMSAAARNAKAVAMHRFAEGSSTLIAPSRPSPLESAGYGR